MAFWAQNLMRAHAQAVVLSSKLDGRFELKTALEIRSPDGHEKLVRPRRAFKPS